MKVCRNLFERIISTENLFTAWEEFRNGKQGRKDVQDFEQRRINKATVRDRILPTRYSR